VGRYKAVVCGLWDDGRGRAEAKTTCMDACCMFLFCFGVLPCSKHASPHKLLLGALDWWSGGPAYRVCRGPPGPPCSYATATTYGCYKPRAHSYTNILFIYTNIYIYCIYELERTQTVQLDRAGSGPDVYKTRLGVLGFSFSCPIWFIRDCACGGGGCPRACAAADPQPVGAVATALRLWRAVAAVPRSGVVAAVPRSVATAPRSGGRAMRGLVRASGIVPEAPRRRHSQDRQGEWSGLEGLKSPFNLIWIAKEI
jgi:hypothetical protein